MEESKKAGEDLQEKLVKKRKYDDSTIASGNMMSLEFLPVLILEKIFSFLPVRDLKNIRLVTSRMSEAVLNLDKRLKTWTIYISSDVPHDTAKVFKHNLNIEIKFEQSEELKDEIDFWLKNHVSCITGIRLKLWPPETFTYLSEKLLVSLSGLNQVRKLDFLNIEEKDVKTLLSSFGHQLESLTVMNEFEEHTEEDTDGTENEVNMSDISLARLKHLRFNNSYKAFKFSILKIAPGTIESLEIIEDDDNLFIQSIDFPSNMFQPDNLKNLEISSCGFTLNLPANLLCKSLARLHLDGVDLEGQEPFKSNLPSLKILELISCTIENDWLTRMLIACSNSLTTLKLWGLGSCSLEESACDLPSLKKISIIQMNDLDVNFLLGKCSSSLEILYLDNVNVNFEVNVPSLEILYLDNVTVNFDINCNVPNLKELHLMHTKVDGFTRLVPPVGSRLESIGLECGVTGSIWDDIVGCNFPSLRTVYMINLLPKRYDKLNASIITTRVKVIKDFDEWRRHLTEDLRI